MKKLEKVVAVARVAGKAVKMIAVMGGTGTIIATGALTGAYAGCKILDKVIYPFIFENYKETMK